MKKIDWNSSTQYRDRFHLYITFLVEKWPKFTFSQSIFESAFAGERRILHTWFFVNYTLVLRLNKIFLFFHFLSGYQNWGWGKKDEATDTIKSKLSKKSVANSGEFDVYFLEYILHSFLWEVHSYVDEHHIIHRYMWNGNGNGHSYLPYIDLTIKNDDIYGWPRSE